MKSGTYQNSLYTIMLTVILLLCFLLRLYKLTSPVGDWHSWRQSDTAAVARNFIKFGFDPLKPRYDDLSNIQSGKANPMGWRMVEFPVYQSFAYLGYRLIPSISIEIWLRLITIAAAVGSAYMLYQIVTIYSDRLTGLLTAFIYSVLPYSVYYGRTILPETTAVFFSLLSLFFLAKYTGDRIKLGYIIGAGLAGSLALLVKPTSGFLLFPAVYILWGNRRKYTEVIGYLLLFSVITITPLLFWRQWEMRFPEGIPAYDWLFNKDNIRLKGAWFYWLFADRIGRLILGYWGILFAGMGILSFFKKKESRMFFWFLLGVLAYFVILAGGNVQHDYYQILALPVVSIYVARGITEILRSPLYAKTASYIFTLILFAFMLMFSWYTVRTYYWINRLDLLEAGKAADSILPPDAKVIAPNNGDTTFLYFINRQGWPQGFDIDQKIEAGATHYITVSVGDSDYETKNLADKYRVLVKNDRYAIIGLQ